MRRLVIVFSHLTNSPTDVPSNADSNAAVTISPVTSSTSAGGTFIATRRSTLCQRL